MNWMYYIHTAVGCVLACASIYDIIMESIHSGILIKATGFRYSVGYVQTLKKKNFCFDNIIRCRNEGRKALKF